MVFTDDRDGRSSMSSRIKYFEVQSIHGVYGNIGSVIACLIAYKVLV